MEIDPDILAHDCTSRLRVVPSRPWEEARSEPWLRGPSRPHSTSASQVQLFHYIRLHFQ